MQSESVSEAPAMLSRTANVQPPESQNAFPHRPNAAFAALGLARTVWNSAVQKVRSSKGTKEIRKFRFLDMTVASAGEDGAGIVHLTLRSPAPEKAEMGIAQHEAVISQVLCGFYGRTVKLRVIGHEQVSTPPDQPPKRIEPDERLHVGKGGKISSSKLRVDRSPDTFTHPQN
ncbi:MAG: hypothetical protein ACLGRW_05225 [Acidobacteriota bacterium]